MNTVKDRTAHQLGMLFIANLELAERIEKLQKELATANQRLHDMAADSAGPSGAKPEDFRGD